MGIVDLSKKIFNKLDNLTRKGKYIDVETLKKPELLKTLYFKVAGVTHENRQDFFKKNVKIGIKNGYFDAYAGKTNKEILEDNDEVFEAEYASLPHLRLEPIKFKGEDAIEVYVNGYMDEKETMIGYVEKEHVKDVLDILKFSKSNPNYRLESDNYIIGGKVKRCNEDMYDPQVIIDELLYGLSVSLKVYDK